ncbi:hypothetical protein [Spirosoma rhododendri]|uniref:Uncharacterized protein n=1 Tax=Spirosoma rhododendri TaxID=2728024 RepID=A0A7L5DQU1_9BACT|nr:hypothetical protein [Spirosoma rhododendri]QJD80844.1 hypothetical protein HH216_22270 [Spirosoma rhododendri]
MKSHYASWLIAGLFLTQVACQSGQKDKTQTADSAAVTGKVDPAVDYVPEAMPTRLADLGLTRDSHWRGVNLGDPFTAVAEHEHEKPFEQDANHVGYTVEFKNLESADMLYYQKDSKVSGIDVDLFLNNKSAVDTYAKELTPYFTTRYGQPKTENNVTTWNGSDGAQVTLKDVSKGKDYGLKIKFRPISTVQ